MTATGVQMGASGRRNFLGSAFVWPILGLLLWLAPAQATSAADVSAQGTLADKEIPFYGVTRYVVRVEAPAGSKVALAPWGENLGGLTVTLQDPELKPLPDGRQAFRQTVVLAPTLPQSYTLPPLTVLVDGVAAAVLEPGVLEVRAPTADEEAEVSEPEPLLTLADLAGERHAWSGWWVRLLVAAAGIGLAWYLAGPPVAPRAVAMGALEEALEALATLEHGVAQGLIDCADVYLRLSMVLRTYLERGLGIQVCELSTPEIASGPLAALPIPRALASRVVDLLLESDRVKFAQVERSRAGQLAAIEAARDAVNRLDAPEIALSPERGAA